MRTILTKTARDLGTLGRDDLFGAGQADAYAAVSAVVPARASPVSRVSDRPAAENAPGGRHGPATRALDQAEAATAADKPAVGEANRPAAR